MSAPHDDGLRAYFGSLYRGLFNDLARVVGALPTLFLLGLAGILHWSRDQHNADGSGTAGYETVILNANVVLLFIFGVLAAHRSGSSWRGTLLFALMNAALGWLIVVAELALD